VRELNRIGASDPVCAGLSGRRRQLSGTHGRNDAAVDQQIASGHEPCVRPAISLLLGMQKPPAALDCS